MEADGNKKNLSRMSKDSKAGRLRTRKYGELRGTTMDVLSVIRLKQQ